MATSLKRAAIYLYGVTRKPALPNPRIPGVDGAAAVEVVECAGLLCWISRVSSLEYADDLARNMENLDWLAQATVNHQRVVSAIAELTEILPARFGTVFLNESTLTADIRSRKRALEADFKRLQGSEEWGVKVFRVQQKVEAPRTAPRTGKDYLKAKAAMLQRRPQQGSDDDIVRFAEELKRIAVDTAEAGKISGGQRGLQWQTSLLLKREHRDKLEALLKRFSRQWAEVRRIECSGPWPPYSFVSRQADSMVR